MSSNLNFLEVGVVSTRATGFKSVYLFRKLLSRSSLLLALIVFMNARSWGQTTVTYAQRSAYYNAGSVFTTGTAGMFNQGDHQVGMYANGGATKQVVAWRKFKTAGDNSGDDRSLRVGDEFRISVSANTVFGEIGFALLANPTTRGSWNNRLENAAVSLRLTNYGNWYATYFGTAENNATSTGSANIGGTNSYKNFQFICLLTAPNRMNITITDGTNTSYLYDVLLNSSNPITEYSIFSSDDWNGNQHRDIFWNTNTLAASDYVKNTQAVSIGNSNQSFSIAGVIPNGNAANSTSTSSTNNLTKTGTGNLTLSNSNTYTGITNIDGGELWIANGGSISSTNVFLGNGGLTTTVTKLWLSNTSGGTTFSNNITVNNGNTTTRYLGGLNNSGTHTFSGNIANNSSGGLYLTAETSGGAVAFSGVISGTNPVLTSGAGTVIISGSSTNTYSGATTIGAATILNKSAGVVAAPSATTINTGITLRTDADNQWGTGTPPIVTISGNGILNLNNTNQKIALASSSSTATVTLGSGTLTIDNTFSDTYAGSISGTGGLTKSNTGTFILTGASNYTGLTTVSQGKLRLNKAGGTIPATNSILVNGGDLEIFENQTIHDLTASSGSITISSGKTLTISGKLSIAPNVTISGNIAYGSTADLEITAAGTTSDIIWPATFGQQNDIIINVSGNVNLHASRTITGSLTLTSGKLVLGSNNLTIESGGSIAAANTSKYIVTDGTGKLTINNVSTSTTFPIGNAKYNPLIIENGSNLNWSASVSDGLNPDPGFLANGRVDLIWDITPSGTPSGADITFQYDATSQVGPDYSSISANMQAYKRNRFDQYWFPVNSSAPALGTPTETTVKIIGLTSFSKYALSKVGSPLPVTFTSLTGSIRNGRANLNWTIADEHNVDRYEVEESANGRQFQSFAQVDAASRSSYQAIDAQLHTGANYYRVKAVDIDGKLTYSKIIRLDNNSAVDNDIRIYPNPSRGEINLGLNIPAGNYQIRLINAVGQTVYQQPLTHEGGSRSLPVSLPKLSQGIYQMEVRGGVVNHVKSVRIE